MLGNNSLPHDPTFKSMSNIVHINEKYWFYLTNIVHMKYYLLTEEDELQRYCKNKIFIPNLMFLTVVARPRFDSQGKETFSRKIRVFPFIAKEPAKRKCVNRAIRTLEPKPITSVNQEVSKKVILEQVIPTMKEFGLKMTYSILFSFNKKMRDVTLKRMTMTSVKLPKKMVLISD